MSSVEHDGAAQPGPNYISDAQQRLLGLILCLSGNEIEGLSPTELAKLNSCTPSNVTRDLANLKHASWAEQIPTTGRWRLSTKPVQLGVRYMVCLDRAHKRLDEIKNRYSRNSGD